MDMQDESAIWEIPVRITLETYMASRCIVSLIIIVVVQSAVAGPNLLQDPGFEEFTWDSENRHYGRNPGAPWYFRDGWQASLRFNANSYLQWNAPEQMINERPLNLSPGTEGYEGNDPDQNRGSIGLVQDIPNPDLSPGDPYEAWIWLGGSGADNDDGDGRADEEGGWRIFFYDNPYTWTWNDENAIAEHRAIFDYYGPPWNFVQITGEGVIPPNTQGVRFRVEAVTWEPTRPGRYGTKVAVDNAYFGTAGPNLLRNGGFDYDHPVGAFLDWTHPDAWQTDPGGVEPLNVDRAHQLEFSDPILLPYVQGGRSYGYIPYLMGWLTDSWTFGQEVDVTIPDGSELALSWYWVLATKFDRANIDMRRNPAWVEATVEYKNGDTVLGQDFCRGFWPSPSHPDNVDPDDFNCRKAINYRYQLFPPSGTNRIGVHGRVVLNMDPIPSDLVDFGVDDFNLRVVATPPPPGAFLLAY